MRSYIFDVDGTIWDATAQVADSWAKCAKRHNAPYEHITEARLKQEFGKILEDIGASLFPDIDPQKRLDILNQCCIEENRDLATTGPDPYDGIEELFKTLSQEHELYIVSNCQAGYIEAMLQKTGLGVYVKDHLCPGDTGNPKAANIKEIVTRHHLEDAVYIGDTMGDYTATKEAGLPFVFASYGFGSVPNPDYTITQPLDLLKI